MKFKNMEYSEIIEKQENLERLINEGYEYIECMDSDIMDSHNYIMHELKPLDDDDISDLIRIVKDMHYKDDEIKDALKEIQAFKNEYNELDKLKKEL